MPVLSYKKGYYVARCVSRCGVEMPIRVADLLIGRPFTCEACRFGMAAPPASRVTTQQDWTTIMAVEVVNQKAIDRNSTRNEEWPAAKRMLELSLAATPFGVAFGWKVYIKSGHRHKTAKKNGIQVVDANPSGRQAWIKLRVAGSRIHWDVSLSWVRQDIEARKVVDALRALSDAMGKPDAEEEDGAGEQLFAEPDESPVATPSLNGTHTPAAVAFVPNLETRLDKVKSGLDRIMSLNRDMGALAELKTAAMAAERAAAEMVAVPRGEYERLSGRQKKLAEEMTALGRQADDLQTRMDNMLKELGEKLATTREAQEMVGGQLNAVNTDMTAAEAVYLPLKSVHEEAVADLRQIEANERERVTALQRVPDLAALLAAFEKMGA